MPPKRQEQKKRHVLLLRHEGEVPREHHVSEIKINTSAEQNPSLKERDDLKLLVIKGGIAPRAARLQQRSLPDFHCSACNTPTYFFFKHTVDFTAFFGY